MSSLQHASPQSSQPQSSFSFTQGFLLGQLSICLLIGAFIKFFIFGEPPNPSETASARALARSKSSASHNAHKRSASLISTSSDSPRRLRNERSASHALRPAPRLTTASILSKTYYNVNSHVPESLDWFNVLIAQTIAQLRTDAQEDNAILTSLTGILNSAQKPDFLSEIQVTEITLGEEFPIFSNCRICPIESNNIDAAGLPDGGPRLQAQMDVDLSDFITLGIETKILLNYPKPLTAVLPVALAVSVVRFSGTLSISFLPSHPQTSPAPQNQQYAQPGPADSYTQQPPTEQTRPTAASPPASAHPTTLAFSFLPDYRLDLSVRSLVGSRSRLQDIPKIAQLVESRLHAWIDERCVEPRVQQVVLPSLWPRKKNTRGPASEPAGEANEERLGVTAGVAGLKRDVREEAQREVDEDRRWSREREGQKGAFEEGLRMRRKEFDMPGGMPGTMGN